MRSKTKPFLRIQMTALVLREGKGREENQGLLVQSALNLCVCQRKEQKAAFLSSPNPSVLKGGRLDRTVFKKKETMPKLVQVSPKQNPKAAQATHLG